MLELNKFENTFTAYLINEVQNNNTYIDNCKNTINSLLKIDKGYLDIRSIYNFNVNILNFNYTTPFLTILNNRKNVIRNVHGSLEENSIILGIDEFSQSDDSYMQFTKTYRTLATTKNNTESLYSNNLDTIKFFGHSLGEADYSYFQSIFDGINLYGGKVKVIFCYSRYHDTESENMLEDQLQYKRVTKLLKKYGNTIPNKAHGKNLLHKLILENRISIKTL